MNKYILIAESFLCVVHLYHHTCAKQQAKESRTEILVQTFFFNLLLALSGSEFNKRCAVNLTQTIRSKVIEGHYRYVKSISGLFFFYPWPLNPN